MKYLYDYKKLHYDCFFLHPITVFHKGKKIPVPIDRLMYLPPQIEAFINHVSVSYEAQRAKVDSKFCQFNENCMMINTANTSIIGQQSTCNFIHISRLIMEKSNNLSFFVSSISFISLFFKIVSTLLRTN